MIRTPPIRAVYFDAVGTLIHPAIPASEKYAEVADRFGISLSADEMRARFIESFRAEERRDRAANWITSEGREIERWRRIVADTITSDEDCFRELYDHYAKPEAWVVDAKAAPLFIQLRERGLLLGLASNYDSRLESVVEGHAVLRSLRPNIVISSQVGHRKPGREFFSVALGRIGLSPNEVAFIGDDIENDFAGAMDTGLFAVLLDPRGRYPECPARIASIGELSGINFERCSTSSPSRPGPSSIPPIDPASR